MTATRVSTTPPQTDRVPLPPRRNAKRRTLRQLPVHIGLIVLCLAWIYPFLWMVSASFKSKAELTLSGAGLIPHNPILDNYVRAWKGASFGQYSLNTVIVVFFHVIIVVLVSAMAGFALGRGRMPGRGTRWPASSLPSPAALMLLR